MAKRFGVVELVEFQCWIELSRSVSTVPLSIRGTFLEGLAKRYLGFSHTTRMKDKRSEEIRLLL